MVSPDDLMLLLIMVFLLIFLTIPDSPPLFWFLHGISSDIPDHLLNLP